MVFRTVYRRLDRIQRSLTFRIVATVIVLASCGAIFGTLLSTSHSLHRQRVDIVNALSGQNLNDSGEHALSLQETGEIFLNNTRYGGPAVLNARFPRFDDDGNVVNIGLIVNLMLQDMRPQWAPTWLLEQPETTWILSVITTVWLLLIIWMALAVPFVLTLAATSIIAGMCQLFGAEKTALAVYGVGMLTFTYVMLTRLMLIILHHPNQIMAVAHTVVKEASRTRISLVFIVLLLIVLPLIPLTLDVDSPLRFRIQTFISRSLGLTFGVAACMTLFLACSSVAFEIRDRQIWQLVTKPLARLNYLLGKWLGVVAVNLIILLVAGVSTFTFIKYLKQQPVAGGVEGQLDALAVNEEVLTARIGRTPDFERLTVDQLRQRVDQIIDADPELSQLERVPLAKRKQFERQLQITYSTGQRTVPPGQARHYTFSGLDQARGLNVTLTLRYKFHILREDDHQSFQAGFVFNDDQSASRLSTYVPAMSHSFPISSSLIRDDGTIKLTLVNLFQGFEDQPGIGALNFEEPDLELLYKVDSFEANFFRAILTTWIKLGFLAALGICCSTLLSFPVACLLSFTVFLSGMLGPYLSEALEWYYPPEAEHLDWSNIAAILVWAFESFTRAVALVIVFLLSSFGEYRPTQNLVEGRLIEWAAVATGFLKLGVLWSGIAMLLGYVVIRNRQLAIYSGHG